MYDNKLKSLKLLQEWRMKDKLFEGFWIMKDQRMNKWNPEWIKNKCILKCLNSFETNNALKFDLLVLIFCYFYVLLISVAKATLQSQICVRLSVSHQNPSASQNHAYQPNLSISAILPLSHHAPTPLSASQNHNYQPSCLSAIIHARNKVTVQVGN